MWRIHSCAYITTPRVLRSRVARSAFCMPESITARRPGAAKTLPTVDPKAGSTEIWSFVNITGDVHPLHVHLVRFQVLNRQTFGVQTYQQTGKLVEKYDVVDVDRRGGGGEYPLQDGFGWTNGVTLQLLDLYGGG